MTGRNLRNRRIPSLTRDIDSDPELHKHRTPSLTHDIDSDPDLAALRESDKAMTSGSFGGGIPPSIFTTSKSTSAGPKTLVNFRRRSDPRLNTNCPAPDVAFDEDDDDEVTAADQERADEIAAGEEKDDEADDDDEDNTNSNALFSSAQARADEMAYGLRERRLKSDAKKAQHKGLETSSEPPSRRSSTFPPQPLAGEANNDILAGTMTLPVPVAIGLIMFAPFAMMLLVMWWHSALRKQNPDQIGEWASRK